MKGFVAELGADGYKHRFGGAEWSIRAAAGALPPPMTLLTLDVSDPRLSITSDILGLPFCSRIDGASLERQSYVFEPIGRVVTFEGAGWHIQIDPADMLPVPLAERGLRLRPVKTEEDPEQVSKFEAQDTFLGGEAFLRVRGEPIWLGDPEEVECACSRRMKFMAAIGYENHEHPSGIVLPDRPFFIGELALYFFVCLSCRRVVVLSQPS